MKLSLLTLLVMLSALLPASAAEDAEMIELAWKRGCFNCHDVDATVRGPAWRDVAERYRGDASAEGELFVKIRDGSSGHWGDDRMSANRRVPEEEIRALLTWLLALEPAAKQQENTGK